MEWEQFWNSLLDEHKLRLKVEEMNQVDRIKGNENNIEEICHCIYDDYTTWRDSCEKVKNELWNVIEQFQGVHLHTSRIKTLDSLIEKVIRKRYEWLADDGSKYANINVENYRDIITDLVGLRLIINYRGHWFDIHDEILKTFPFDENRKYEKDKLLAHIPRCNVQAELPKVYYAEGDDIRKFVEKGLIPKKHKMNYRSIHYTISFQGVYIEIQIRTIYDEAWSDCDHNYVYKKDDNRSHSALQQMSGILSKLTNLSNDIGERMKDIYDSEALVENPGKGWQATEDVLMEFDKFVKRMADIEYEMKEFRGMLTSAKRVDKGGGGNGEI